MFKPESLKMKEVENKKEAPIIQRLLIKLLFKMR